MRRTRINTSVLLVASALAVATAAAEAAAPPTADSPGCVGLIAGELNHAAGGYGATDNPKSSSGPG